MQADCIPRQNQIFMRANDEISSIGGDLTMESILDLDLFALVAWLCFIPAASAVILYVVTQHGPLAGFFQQFRDVVAPYFVSVGILFAVFAAFLGNDIWLRVQEINHSLEKEVANVQSIVQIARSLGENGAPVLSAARQYVDATLDLELSEDGQARSTVSDSALEAVAQEILNLPQDDARSGVAQGAMLAAYERVWEARTTRRHIADTHSDPLKWVAVLFLGILTQVALTLCHIDKRKPLAAALFVFSLAFIATMVALGTHERPLSDPNLVSLEHMERILSEAVGLQ